MLLDKIIQKSPALIILCYVSICFSVEVKVTEKGLYDAQSGSLINNEIKNTVTSAGQTHERFLYDLTN